VSAISASSERMRPIGLPQMSGSRVLLFSAGRPSSLRLFSRRGLRTGHLRAQTLPSTANRILPPSLRMLGLGRFDFPLDYMFPFCF